MRRLKEIIAHAWREAVCWVRRHEFILGWILVLLFCGALWYCVISWVATW